MIFLFCLFLVALLCGQLIRIPLVSGAIIYPHDIVLAILYIFWFSRKHAEKPVKLALLMPIALFLGIALFSLLIQAYRYSPWEVRVGSMYFFRFLFYAGLYKVAVEYAKPRVLLLGLWLYGIGLGGLGLVQYFLYPNLRNLSYLGWDPHYYRLFSTLLDPNFTGILLVLAFWVGMIFWERKLIKRGFLITGQLLLLISLLLTFSRSSILAFVISATIYMVLLKKWMVAMVIVILVLLFLFVPRLGGTSSSFFREDSSFARVTNWQQSIEVIQKKPIMGYGFNMLRSVKTPSWFDANNNQISHADSGIDNSFLFVLATTGIIGGVAWAYLWYRISLMGYSSWRKRKDIYGIVLFTCALGALSDSMFINSMFYPWVVIFLWVLVGSTERLLKKK